MLAVVATILKLNSPFCCVALVPWFFETPTYIIWNQSKSNIQSTRQHAFFFYEENLYTQQYAVQVASTATESVVMITFERFTRSLVKDNSDAVFLPFASDAGKIITLLVDSPIKIQ